MKRVILLFLCSAGFAQTNGPAPFYQAYTGSAIVQPPSTPNLGNLVKNNAVTIDTSYPSGTPSKVARCTDQNTNPSNPNQSMSAGIGGSGDGMPLFNSNDTLIRLNTSGAVGIIVPFNPYTLVCGPALNQSQNLTNPGSANTVAGFGAGYFDWQNPTLYTGQSGASLVQYTINPATGNFSVGNAFVNFQLSIPYGSLVAAWQASTSYTSGQYVTYTLTSGQAPNWAASNAYSTLGTIILPTANNPLGCAFKLTTTGTSGSSSPTWSTTGNCKAASNSTISDGSAAWRNLGGAPTFTYQLTSGNCTSGSSTPAFVPVSTGRPDLMTTVSDNTCTWTNTGPEIPIVSPDLAGVSYDGTRVCEDFSTNSYGYNNNYTTYNQDQGSGQWVSCYDSTTNTYVTLNTVTGWQSTVACTGGTGYNCSGGTQVMNPVGVYPLITSGGCGFFMHNSKGSLGMDYPVIVQQAFLAGSSGCITGDAYSWQPFVSFNSSTTLQGYLGSLNHWAEFNSHLLQVGQSSSTFGFTTGAYTNIYDSTNPYTLADILISWQPTCIVTSTWPVNGNSLPPCQFGLAYDSHMSAAHNPAGQDLSPACGTMYDLSSISVVNAPWQNEEICIPISPTWANGSSPVGQNAPWRFTHTFNSGTNSFFDTQFGISQLSTDGHFLAFSSDWFCTLGTVSGGTSSLCGLTWTPSTAYTSGQLLNPFSSFTGSGTNYGVYKVTTAGTSSATTPTWVTCTNNTIAITSGHAGTGYVVGDQITIVQGGASGGTQIVTSIGSSGSVTGLGNNTNGTSYTTATGLSTTGGTGSGLEVDITAVGNSGTTVTDGAGVVYTCQGKSNGVGQVFIVQLAPFPVAFSGGVL